MSTTITRVSLCTDCTMLIANDDLSSLSAADEASHRDRVSNYMSEHYAVGESLVVGDSDRDDEFSRAECAACGTTLAGYRFDAAVLS